MIQLWNRLSNIGLRKNLNIFEQRKIRIINQTNLQVAICCFFILIFYLIIDYTDFVWIAALTICLTTVPILCNYFQKFIWAKTSFILMFFLLELLIARVLGAPSYIEFCVLLLPVSAILLFNKDSFKQNVLLTLMGIGGFLVCEYVYASTIPIVTLPNLLVYKIITCCTLCLAIFQNVRFFKLDLLHIEQLNRSQNEALQLKQILIEEQNNTLRQINAKLLSEIEAKKIAEQRLMAANIELQQFATMASHDMKEPLRTISSFSSLLSRQIPADKDAQDYLFFIKDAAERMARLLNDLISFARAGKDTETLTSVNLNDVILMVKNNLHTSIEQNKSIVRCHNLPVIEGHFTPFMQLLQNLIANSIKYQKPDHQAIVNISYEDLGDHCQIKISDNGIGIKKEYLERIFSPFTRLHTQQEYKGSGIGLAICMKIVQRYGGKIWVESELDVGTTFYVRLPKKQKDDKYIEKIYEMELQG